MPKPDGKVKMKENSRHAKFEHRQKFMKIVRKRISAMHN